MYKITNKTFQPIQIIFGSEETYLLGSTKPNNIIELRSLNAQLKNLEKKGMIKVRKL